MEYSLLFALIGHYSGSDSFWIICKEDIEILIKLQQAIGGGAQILSDINDKNIR